MMPVVCRLWLQLERGPRRWLVVRQVCGDRVLWAADIEEANNLLQEDPNHPDGLFVQATLGTGQVISRHPGPY